MFGAIQDSSGLPPLLPLLRFESAGHAWLHQRTRERCGSQRCPGRQQDWRRRRPRAAVSSAAASSGCCRGRRWSRWRRRSRCRRLRRYRRLRRRRGPNRCAISRRSCQASRGRRARSGTPSRTRRRGAHPSASALASSADTARPASADHSTSGGPWWCSRTPFAAGSTVLRSARTSAT